ncbi:MAG: hypothetical protein ACRC8S_21510 [Fimbriiglobus sp.]
MATRLNESVILHIDGTQVPVSPSCTVEDILSAYFVEQRIKDRQELPVDFPARYRNAARRTGAEKNQYLSDMLMSSLNDVVPVEHLDTVKDLLRHLVPHISFPGAGEYIKSSLLAKEHAAESADLNEQIAPSADQHRIVVNKDLRQAVPLAIEQANQHTRPVFIRINQVEFEVLPGSNPENVEANFERALSDYREKYKQTPTYKYLKAEYDQETIADQKLLDLLVRELPSALPEGEAATVFWMCRFADHSGRIGTKCDRKTIADQLLKAGYLPPPEHIVTDDDHLPASSKAARSLVGQVLGHLLTNTPIPQLAQDFDEYYRELVSAEASAQSKAWTNSLGARTGRRKSG